MKQEHLGYNQQVYVGVAGEVFSANFVSYFNGFINELYSKLLTPTPVVFFKGQVYPSTLIHYFNDVLQRSDTAGIMILDHALPKTTNFLSNKAVFFYDEFDKHRGFYFNSEVVNLIKVDVAFPPISHPEWLYINLKTHLQDLGISWVEEQPDVLL